MRFIWGETVLSYSIPSSGSVCGTPANAKAFPAGLAGLPQTPTASPRDLRDSRKRQPNLRGTCGIPANATAFPVRLAGIPQTPTASPWDLRDSRKRQPHLRETCGTPANANRISVRLAGIPQTLNQYRNSPNSLRMINSFRSADSTRPTMRASMPNERLRAMTSSARAASK